MTPRQFSALLKRRKQILERDRVLVASLRCVIANLSMCRPKEPLTVDDFLGTSKPERRDTDMAEFIAGKLQIMAVKPGVPMATNIR
jgi:hypothetical protein